MNEMEAHYAGQGSGGGSHAGGNTGARSGSGQGGASGSEGVVERVTEAARSAADAARDTYDRAADMARDNYRTASRTVSTAQRRSAAQLNQGWDTVESFVTENPVMIGVVGLAAGLLVGALLPLTRRENQVFGRYADELKDQGMRYARDLAEQGKSLVEENLHNVTQGMGNREAGRGPGMPRV